MTLTQNDKAALELAIEHARAQDAGRREQIDAKLQDEPWEEVATFAAYCCQTRSLHLKPWEDPPMWVDEDADLAEESDFNNHREAQRLLKQMLELGISRWHPNPLEAIAAKKVN